MIDTLHFQFLAVHTLFLRIFLRNLRKHYPELLPGQPKVIDFLLTVESAYQKEIADACLMEPATLCLILEKMEYSGLVKREKLPDNRKNIVVSLTAKGREIGTFASKIFAATEDQVCHGLDQSERHELLRLLKKLYINELGIQNETPLQ